MFGKGHMAEMRAEVERGRGGEAGEVREYRLPLLAEVSEWSDKGDPFVLRAEGGAQGEGVRNEYKRMAEDVRQWMEGAEGEGVKVRWEAGEGGQDGMVVMEAGDKTVYVEGPLLRGECRCAGCVDEVTGVRRAGAEGRRGVQVVGLQPKGNYGVAVAWSDGHASSIYTHQHMAELGRPTKEEAHLFAQQRVRPSSHQHQHSLGEHS